MNHPPSTLLKRHLSVLALVLGSVVAFLALSIASFVSQVSAQTAGETSEATSESVTAPGFDRRAMLENVALNVILPCHETFAAEAEGFEAAAAAFAADPGAETLAAAQAAWRAAGRAWAECEAYAFGGLEVMILHNQIDKTPINPLQIEGFIEGEDSLDAAFIESKGSTARGLGAAEYLLFDPAGDASVLERFGEARRGAYLSALATNLKAKAADLVAYWSPAGEAYAATFAAADEAGGSVKGSTNMIVNEMIAALEGVAREKLALPLGDLDGAAPQPDAAESALSRTSLERVEGNLTGLERLFTGGAGLGLDDYLRFLGQDALAAQIADEFGAALAAVAAVGEPLETAVSDRPEALRQVYDAVRTLLVSVSVDGANQLGITVTFSDSDGD